MSIILQVSVHFQAGQGSIGKLRHNKRLKRDCQRVAFPVPMSRGVTVVVIEFVVMRCQPLRRALVFRGNEQ
ncbi:hypothetical protein DYB88_18025 [Vibrio cholerae]|nr:hypothetical protein [Vibrio cholerae]